MRVSYGGILALRSGLASMIDYWRLIVSILLLCTMLSETLEAQGFPQGRDVIVASGSGGYNVYFPDVCVLSNGELIVVFYQSPAHVSPMGRISLVRSTDQGITWSEPSVIIDTPTDDRDPSVVQLKNGTLLLNWFTHEKIDHAYVDQVYISRSNDNGKTWDSPQLISCTFPNAACSDKVLELSTGDLLLPMYVFDGDGEFSMSAIIRSSDGGVRWPSSSLQIIARDPKKEYPFSEPALIELQNGVLLGLSRNDYGNSFESLSFDHGYHWIPARKVSLFAHAPNLLRLSGGNIFATFGDVSGKYGPGRHVVSLVKSSSDDWGAGRENLIYQALNRYDATYPSSVLIDDSTVFTVFYDAAEQFIGGRFSALSPLDRAPDTSSALASIGEQVARKYDLYQNFPNPFNLTTFISYEIPDDGMVHLEVYDVLGRHISTVVDDEQQSGFHSAVWWWGGASGIYIYRLTVTPLETSKQPFTRTGRMVLLK